MDDLDHHLVRTYCCQHVLTQSLGLDIVAEVLGNAVTHVGIEQRPAHFLQSFGYIDLGDTALTFDYLE